MLRDSPLGAAVSIVPCDVLADKMGTAGRVDK